MPRILVVDDSAMDRLIARRLLEKNAEFIVALADDGADAIQQLEEITPDIVVTDLQMPNVDGLELVEVIRRRFPFVPIILMTAHGSEEVAARALMSGAASYVPKADLPRHLLDTVENVLASNRNNRRSHDLFDCLEERNFEFQLDNDSRVIAPLVDQLQQAALSVGLVDETGRIQLAVALEASLFNALYQGNLELSLDDMEEWRSSLMASGEDRIAQRCRTAPFRDRRIHVSATITRDEGRFVIRDDGSRQRTDTLPDVNDPANMTREKGRGLVLMGMFMDEVRRNKQGNQVELVKRRKL